MVQALRDQGLRITAARRAICTILAESHGAHLTAADIYDRTTAIAELSVDQSTVYRTLETLEDSGLVQHTHMGHGALVYHLADEPPHQHLVCASCGRTMAVPQAELASFFTGITDATGFVPDPSHVALSGLCADCSEAAEG